MPWAIFRQQTTGADQVFSRSFANGVWTTRGSGTVGGRSSASPTFGGSLNFDQGQDGEAPAIDFAGAADVIGAGRKVPWATWYENTTGTGFGQNNIFASRFDSTQGKWIFAGQSRGNGGSGPNVPSLNIHTDQSHQLGEWVVDYTVVSQDGDPVISELHISAGDIDDPDQPGRVPPGGISARLLRRLRPAAALRYARSALAERARPEDPLADAVALHGYRELALEGDRRPGRRGRTDRFYAEIAAAYVQVMDAESLHPVKDVAERMNYSRARIRDLLGEARRRGLLTGTSRGRAAGRLTDKARRALESGENNHDPSKHQGTSQRGAVERQTASSQPPPADGTALKRPRGGWARQVKREIGIE